METKLSMSASWNLQTFRFLSTAFWLFLKYSKYFLEKFKMVFEDFLVSFSGKCIDSRMTAGFGFFSTSANFDFHLL